MKIKQQTTTEAPDRSGWSPPPSRTSTPAARCSRQHHMSHVCHYHTSPPLSDVPAIITCLCHYPLLIYFLSGNSRHLPTLLTSSPFFPAPATPRHRCGAFVLIFCNFVLVVFVTIVIVIIIFTIVIDIIIIVINPISSGRRPRNFQTKMPSPTTAPILTCYTTLCPHYIIYFKPTLLPTTYLSSTMIT